ncbi:small integral membrane protein 26 [Trichosurus vulpecula]|uniref:small integral membrane protein 26 n=1 Tax=Trichosurus vulpecula TaxID=9337 RepID=UPI00186B4D44|nr:small integral membrane protein 26 [Trichosurus vulpecula]
MQALASSIWYRRMSLVYLIGAWTTVGSICLSRWKRRQPLAKEEALKDEDLAKEESLEDKAFSVEKPEARRGFYVETIVTYKENFVPYTTRLYNYWKSWSNGPSPSE